MSQYKVLSGKGVTTQEAERKLNALAAEGYELVSVSSSGTMILKRSKNWKLEQVVEEFFADVEDEDDDDDEDCNSWLAK